MTLQELAEAVSKMTPGPWHDIPHPGWEGADHRISDDSGAEWGRYGLIASVCAKDSPGLVALRNHADALIECARFLKEAQTCSAECCDCIAHSGDLKARIDAALARVGAV